MVTCTVCNKSFKNTQGLRGHNFFVHTNNGDQDAERAAQVAEQSSGFSQVPVSAKRRLSSLEERLALLEQATGVSQSNEADKVPSNSRKPLVEQMAELANQLKTLASNSISYAELSPAFEKIGQLARQLDSLDASHNSMVTTLGNFANQLNTKVDQEMFSHLQARISLLEKREAEVDKLLVTMQKAQVDSQQQVVSVINSVVERLARAEILTRRFPTGEIVGMKDIAAAYREYLWRNHDTGFMSLAWVDTILEGCFSNCLTVPSPDSMQKRLFEHN